MLTRTVTQREEQAAAAAAERDDWRRKAELATAGDAKDPRAKLQQMHLELQEQFSLCKQRLNECTRDRQQLQVVCDTAREELSTAKKSLHEALLQKEDAETRIAIVTKELALCQQTCSGQNDDLTHSSTETARLRMDCEDLREEVGRERMRAERAQRGEAESERLLETRTQELAEATHQLALRDVGGGGGSGGGGEVEVQLREDRRRLQVKVQDLEAEQQR